MKRIKYYLPGAFFMMLAFLILALPELLVVLAASLFIIAGATALYIGHHMRKYDITNFDDFYYRRPIFMFRHTRF